MASTSSKQAKKPLKYAISYGLAGGNLHSRHFRKAMVEAGFQHVAKDEADIIIAHSAGCWLIPKNSSPQLVLYVGMPLANQKPSVTWRKALKSGYSNNSLRRNLKISSKNTFYSLTQPRRNIRIIRQASNFEPSTFKGARNIFIANHFDPWPQGPKLGSFIDDHNWAFLNLEGSHDNIWDNPERYVAIIKQYAGLLAKTKSK